MRICILSTYPPQRGGVAVHTAGLSKSLAKRHDVSIITYGRLGRKGKVMEVIVPPVKFLRGLFFLFGSMMKMRSLEKGRKIDIIHAQYVHPAGTAAVLYRRLSRSDAKVVITAHGSDLNLPGWLVSGVVNSCDRLICVSKYLAEKARSLGVHKGIDVVYNSFDVKPPKAEAKELRKDLKLSVGEKIILFAGSLTGQKGADLFIEEAKGILRKEPGAFFVLVGKGKLRKKLERFCKRNDIFGSVLFAGEKGREETLRYIKASDLVLVPSKDEGFGLVALESASMGVPVLAGPVGSLPEVLAPVSITDDLVGKSLEVLSDERSRKKVIMENAKSCKKFTPKAMVDGTEMVYRSVKS